VCPFINTRKKSGCREGKGSGMYELSSLNDLSNLIKHLKSGHATNPSALIAAARVKKVDEFLKISPELLDTECGEIIWEPTEADMEDGHEEIRKPIDSEDRFEPDFELDGDEHHEWVRNAKADFE
tara:strand:- start:478 stop:852 length:375 start_codon:yes stop_codon:yes gene_type:complete